jgi:hypothetical protein
MTLQLIWPGQTLVDEIKMCGAVSFDLITKFPTRYRKWSNVRHTEGQVRATQEELKVCVAIGRNQILVKSHFRRDFSETSLQKKVGQRAKTVKAYTHRNDVVYTVGVL